MSNASPEPLARRSSRAPTGEGEFRWGLYSLVLTGVLSCTSDSARVAPNSPVDSLRGTADEQVLDVLTYNVAGLPSWISPFDGRETHPKIGAALAPFDLVLLQEDFWYHDSLKAPQPWSARPRAGAWLRLGDGLARLSKWPLTEVEHVTWRRAHGLFGDKHDRWALKGFAVGKLLLGGSRHLWVYNLHGDAGRAPGDRRARELQRFQLMKDIAQRVPIGDALLVAGDFNCGPDDLLPLLRANSLTDAGVGGIDRILLRSGARVKLHVEPTSPEAAPSLTPFAGLSDHFPVQLRLRVSLEPASNSAGSPSPGT